MYTPKDLRLFTQRSNQLRFFASKNSATSANPKYRYRVLYLPENIDFLLASNKFNFYPNEMKHMVIPRANLPKMGIRLGKQYQDYYKKMKQELGSFIVNLRRQPVEKQEKNYILDTSLILDMFSKKYPTTNMKKMRVELLYNYIMLQYMTPVDTPSSLKKKAAGIFADQDQKELSELFTKDPYYNVILYTVDVSKPLDEYFYTKKVFPLIYFWLRNNKSFPAEIDFIILSAINTKDVDSKPVFIKIYDRFQDISGTTYYNKWKQILGMLLKTQKEKGILKNFSEKAQEIEIDINQILTEEDLKTLQSDLVDTISTKDRENNFLHLEDKDLDITNFKYKLITSATKLFAENVKIEKSFKEIITDTKDEDLKKLIKLGIFSIAMDYYINSNKELALKRYSYLKNMINLKRKNPEEFLKKEHHIMAYFKMLLSKNINKVIENYKFKKSISINPIIESINLRQMVDDKIPETLFYKRQKDFVYQVKNDLVKLCETMTKKDDFPLQLIDIVEEPYIDNREIKKTAIRFYRLIFKDKEGKYHRVKIGFPQIAEDGTILVNGHKKIIINQIILNPVYFDKPYSCKVTSFFSTMNLQNRSYTKGNRYLWVFAMGLHFPALLLLAAIKRNEGGLDFVLKDLNITYTVTNDTKTIRKFKKTHSEVIVIELYDSKFVISLDNLESYKKSLLFGLKKVPFKKYRITKDILFNNLKSVLVAATKHIDSEYKMRFFTEAFLDSITKENLEATGYPTNLYDLILVISKKIENPIIDERNDYSIQRLRSSEIFAHGVYKQLIKSYYEYVVKKSNGIKDATLKVDPLKVFKSIANSQVVRMYESINPVEQLSLITRTTYIGLGGLGNPDGASATMRSVHPSHFGLISATDTPEGGTVGIINHLTVGALLKDNRGHFNIKKINNLEKVGLLSASDVFTPFNNHNEPTRNLMAANQVKQALPLDNKEPPLVQTGYESILSNFLDNSFLIKAPVSGKVIKVSEKEINIKPKKGNTVKVKLKPNILISGQAIHSVSYLEPIVKNGQNVKQGQLIAEGASIVDGTISLGKNLLTAYMSYRGGNFEDGIIINSKLLERKELYSTHIEKVEVFIQKGSKILVTPFKNNPSIKSKTQAISDLINSSKTSGGIPYKKGQIVLSYIPPNISDYISLDDESISENGGIEVSAEHDSRLINMEVYPNIRLSEEEEIKDLWIASSKKNPDLYGDVNPGEFKYKGESFEGTVIVFYFEYKETGINIGDKYCNRHGNKGTICLIEDKMPVTPWGQEIDIISNPLGVISRMNMGQKYELYCGLISWKLRELMLKNPTKKNGINLIKKIYYDCLDKSPNKIVSTNIMKVFSKMSERQYKNYLETFVRPRKGFSLIIPNFNSPSIFDINKAMNRLNLKPSYILNLPALGSNVKTKLPVAVGYIYFYKLEHVSSKKMSARSEGKYMTKYLQPPAGKKRGGGQRVGEFDSWSILQYGADNVIKEFFGPLSDDIKLKQHIIRQIIDNGEASISDIKEFRSGSKELFLAYLRMMLLDIK